jgi:hypothetical protein
MIGVDWIRPNTEIRLQERVGQYKVGQPYDNSSSGRGGIQVSPKISGTDLLLRYNGC